jgi:hypothetical protein
MMLVYVTGFFSVAAEWFWGRWFATGLGYWGLTMTVMAFVASRELPPAMVIFGVMHSLVVLCLAGEKMAGAFDAKPGWRERWKLDEQGVIRVRKSVTRAASSLPALIMFALAPRESAALALCAFAVLGVVGLLTARTWGLFALLGSGVAALATALLVGPTVVSPLAANLFGGLLPLVQSPAWGVGFAGVMLCAAALPFISPMGRFLRAR